MKKTVNYVYLFLFAGSLIFGIALYELASVPSNIAWPAAIGLSSAKILPLLYSLIRMRNFKDGLYELMEVSDIYARSSSGVRKFSLFFWLTFVIVFDLYAMHQVGLKQVAGMQTSLHSVQTTER